MGQSLDPLAAPAGCLQSALLLYYRTVWVLENLLFVSFWGEIWDKVGKLDGFASMKNRLREKTESKVQPLPAVAISLLI